MKLGERMAKFKVIIEKDEDGYFVASVPSIPGCHTQAKSMSQLMERVKDAIGLCLEEDAEVARSQFVGIRTVAVKLHARPAPA